MYLSIENFTCPKEQISLYLTVLKLFFQKLYETRSYISTLVDSMDPDQLASLVKSVDLKKPADQGPHCFQCKM